MNSARGIHPSNGEAFGQELPGVATDQMGPQMVGEMLTGNEDNQL